MPKYALCDYSEVFIHISGTTTTPNIGTTAAPNNRKNIIVKDYAPFPDCIIEANNRQIDNE